MFELLLLAAVGALVALGQRAPVVPATPSPGTPGAGAAPAGDGVAPSSQIDEQARPADPEVRANGVIAPAVDPAYYGVLGAETTPPVTPAEVAYHDEIANLISTDPDAAQFVRFAD